MVACGRSNKEEKVYVIMENNGGKDIDREKIDREVLTEFYKET